MTNKKKVILSITLLIVCAGFLLPSINLQPQPSQENYLTTNLPKTINNTIPVYYYCTTTEPLCKTQTQIIQQLNQTTQNLTFIKYKPEIDLEGLDQEDQKMIYYYSAQKFPLIIIGNRIFNQQRIITTEEIQDYITQPQ